MNTRLIAIAAMVLSLNVTAQTAIDAAGGTITEVNGYRLHTFTENGTFSITDSGVVEVLVVAGGGGGGGGAMSGGGGAGGLIYTTAYPVAAGNYAVTNGAGGLGGYAYNLTFQTGLRGANSSFGTNLIAIGGGGGAGWTGHASTPGGSGGGGNSAEGASAGTNGQGYAGNVGNSTSSKRSGGGGGGASETGGLGTAGVGGKGGNGRNIFGSYYGGGGGGGLESTLLKADGGGAGGAGGGGAGSSGTTKATDAEPNTGGGGGGTGYSGGGSDRLGGNGGSGVVIVRYHLPITNADGATNITVSSAWLNGVLYATGTSSTAVSVYWGTADGGTNASSWANTNTWATPQTLGDFTFQATDLTSPSCIYYRFSAICDGKRFWAPESAHFITGEIALTLESNAVEGTLTSGTFAVTRPGTTTNGALTVTYTQSGGSAISGVDFTALSGSVILPAGAASADIVVTPLKNYLISNSTTIELTLTGALAPIGASSSATLTIINEGIPSSPTNVWLRTGVNAMASVDANWSLGHAPTNGNAIVYLSPFATKADMAWNLTNSIAGWIQTEDYTGTVTVATFYPGQGAFTNLTILGNCTINGGVMTHAANTGASIAKERLAVTIQGNLTIGSNGRIDVDGKGYAAGQGPGAGTPNNQVSRGASHGGLGGEGEKRYGDRLVMPYPTYGAFTEPLTLGSGGSKAGGGAVLLQVGGLTRLYGKITATAALGSGRFSGPAGGSIYLTTGSLEGDGPLIAAGRGGSDGTDSSGGGGGGRIAVILTNSDTFGTVAITAPGGKDLSRVPGAAGTVYLQTQGQAKGEGVLIIDNAPQIISPDFLIGTLMPEASAYNAAPDLSHLASIIITNQGRLILNTNTVFDFGAGNLTAAGFADASVVIAGTNGLSFPAEFTVSIQYQLFINTTVSATGNWRVPTGAVLSHFKNFEREIYKFGLILNGNLTIDAGGTISADGCGYKSAIYTEYAGPAAGGGAAGGYGSSYGGMGGISYAALPAAGLPANPTYGSVTAPFDIGSGAGYPGNGAIFLDIRGTTTVNGTITSRLTNNNLKAAGSSGGSIWLTTRQLAGTGLIDASGKPSSYSNSAGTSSGGGGGGGRISVLVTEGNSLGNVQMKAPGGRNTSTGWQYQSGAAGTIYTQTANEGTRGRLLVANDNWDMGTGVATNTLTLIPAPTGALANEERLATLVVTNYAYAALTKNLTVGDLFLATNAPNRLFLKGHTLKVNSYFHKDWGDDAWVVYDGGQIVWKSGTVLMVR